MIRNENQREKVFILQLPENKLSPWTFLMTIKKIHSCLCGLFRCLIRSCLTSKKNCEVTYKRVIENEVMLRKTDSKIVNPKADTNRPRRLIIQDFLVIWLDRNKGRTDEKHHRILAQIQNIVHEINIFNDIDE